MAQFKRTAAGYMAESRNTTVNPFEGLTKQQMEKKYDQEIRESGKSAKELRKIANQMQAALRRSVKKPTTKQKVDKKVESTTLTKPKSTPVKPKTSDKAVKGGYTISPKKRKAGTRGAAEQPKPKTKPRRGSGVKRTGKKVNLGKALQNLSDKFKLTRKAGEVFTVGNMKYVSDGKGGIRSSQRFR